MQKGPQFDLGGDSVATRYRRAGRKRRLGPWRLLGLVFVGAILIAYAVARWGSSAKDSRGPAAQQGVAVNGPANSQEHRARSTSVPTSQPSAGAESVASDNSRRLWVSPTRGHPLDLHYLPAGTQLLVHVRPQALWDHPEGEKIVAVLGPWGERLLAGFGQWYPGSCREVPALMLALGSDARGKLHYALRIELASPWTSDMLRERMGRYERGPCTPAYHLGQTCWVAAGLAYWLPPDAAGDILVVCAGADMPGLIERGHEPIGLPRDVQRLVASTDRQRIFTALLLEKFLHAAGQQVLGGNRETMPALPAAMAWLWGEDATAALLSLHWDRDFFVELLATATLNVRPHHFARQLDERISALPQWCQRNMHTLALEPYGRQVLARLPGMLRQLKIYTRSGSEQGHAVLRCYLPVQAGHNLLLAGALSLTAAAGADHEVAKVGTGRQATKTRSGTTLEEKLASITALVLPKETLEHSLQLLAEDIGADIEILGQDLQLAGITKNQSLGIDLRDQPASKILLEILRRANPDRTATGPADPRQMLVYIIKRSEEGSRRIFVTTRTAAAARGDKFPDVFHASSQ